MSVDGVDVVDLFDVLVALRAANADALLALFFEKRRIPERTAMRRLADLVRRGFLGHVRLDGTRCLYHLTTKGLATSRHHASATDWIRRPPPRRQADYCWLRAALIAALAREGWDVGRSWLHQHWLHQYLVEAQRRVVARARGHDARHAQRTLDGIAADESLVPMWRACCSCGWRGEPRAHTAACERCRAKVERKYTQRFFKCTGCAFTSDEVRSHRDGDGARCVAELREADPLPFDVAFRGSEVLVLLVDNPSRQLEVQFRELPIFWTDAPRLPIIVRSADPDSRFDAAAGTYATKGARHSALLRLISGRVAALSFLPERLRLIDFKPRVQLRFVR